MEESGRRPKRESAVKFKGDYQFNDFSDESGEEAGASGGRQRGRKAAQPRPKSMGRMRTKECPGCSAILAVSTKECVYCDFQFTSKSMLVSQVSANEESQLIRDRFPFEPEREEDGSLKIQCILGRRLRKSGKRWLRHGHLHDVPVTAVDAKFDYEYLIKYKTMSYMHVQWLTAHDIDAMNHKSRQALQRYLNKIDKGEIGAADDGEIDPSSLEVDKILDMREEEVSEIIDDPPPAVELASTGTEPVEPTGIFGGEVTNPFETDADSGRNLTNGGVSFNSSSSAFTTDVTTADAAGAAATGGETLEGGVSATNSLEPKEEVHLSIGKIWQPEERCRRVLERIWEDPYAVSFQTPVDTTVYDDYLDVVGDAICLADVKARLEAGGYKGQTMGKFANDMRMIWKNCKMYNLYKSQIWHSAHALSIHFERLFQAWVLSFHDGSVPMHLSVGRPWEPTCRECLSGSEEEFVLLCDHCDANYHTFCLHPPLKEVPEGPWMCPRCIKWLAKSGAKLLSAAAEDEARQAAEVACQRKIVFNRVRKYLVKWRGLSYRECTWETAKDLNDDEKIAEFHKYNDAPPEEPPLTQAEIGAELAKERKLQLFPAMINPNLTRELEATIYAQIRTYHFLRWNKIPTDALLKECGPSTFGVAHGNRSIMAVPAYVKTVIDKISQGVEEEEAGEEGAGEAKVTELEEEETQQPPEGEDQMDVAETKESSANEKERSGDGDDDEDGSDGYDSSSRRPAKDDAEGEAEVEVKKKSYLRPSRLNNVSERFDAQEAIREAELLLKGLPKGPKFDKTLTWYSPPQLDVVRGEVTEILSELLHHIPRGTMPCPEPSRPKLAPNEIEVCIPKGTSGLYMNIGDYRDRVVVLGFRKREDSSMAPAESCGKIKIGDILVAVNGIYITKLKFKYIIKLLASKVHPFFFLRFLRISHESQGSVEPLIASRADLPPSRSSLPLRSQYFGVYPVLENDQVRWSAEHYLDFQRIVIGEFDTELEAALAYDDARRHPAAGLSQALASPIVESVWRINFDEEGRKTADSQMLQRVVEEEKKISSNRLRNLIQTDPKKSLPFSIDDVSNCFSKRDFEEAAAATHSDLETDKEELRGSYSQDSEDSDSERVGSVKSGSDDEENVSVSSDEAGWESDNRDGEWRPKEELEADGPLGRLLRAVNESDLAPSRGEWMHYIKEMGMEEEAADGSRMRRVEQLDMVLGNVIRIWESAASASRTLNIPVHNIHHALKGRTDSSGGFRWRYFKPSAAVKVDAEEPDELKKDLESWSSKLHRKSKEYRSGGTLRDYQLDGLNWLLRCWYSKRSSILADEMGLGKTVQVISFLDHLYEVENIRGPFLVAVPLSTIEHWKREAEGWSHMVVCLYHDTGGGRDMRDVIREFEWYYKGRSRRLLKFHLLITTYDDLIKDYEELAEVPWRVVVVDEAHRLRNVNSKLLECMRSVVVKGQHAYGYQHRVLMTGTPLQNNTHELWTLMNFIEPAKFPDLEKFAQRFGNIQTQEQVETLQRRIAPHLLRRVKEDVAKDIPPKEETIIDVELTTMQKQYYRAIFERNHGFLIQSTKGSLPKLMNIQMELRKCCNHPYLISGVEQNEMETLEQMIEREKKERTGTTGSRLSLAAMSDVTNGRAMNENRIFNMRRMNDYLVPSSGKMVLLDKLLPKLKAERHKVLIFSQMVKMLDILEEFCELREYHVERLDGRVQGNDRQKSIDRFNQSDDSFVFLLSTRAGGVGINLTAADTVIIFDSDWNPQNDVQAMARCHRIGQSKNVKIYRLITRRSFEAEMFERASKKLGLEQALLGNRQFSDAEMEDSQKSAAKMDTKELELLLRQGAYAVLLEDDTEAVKEFFEQDIESLLDQRSHVRVVEGQAGTETWLNKKKKPKATKSMFTGDSAMEHAEVDVNDPDFWKKVLPDLVTPDMMLMRLEDEVTVDCEEDDEVSVAVVDKFMKDMTSMMEGILDLHRRNQLPDRERVLCMKLLLRVTLRTSQFDEGQIMIASEWLSSLEGTRNRRLSRADAQHGGSDDDLGRLPIRKTRGGAIRGGRGGRGAGRGRGRGTRREREVDLDTWQPTRSAMLRSDSEVDSDEEFTDKKTDKRKSGGTVGKGGPVAKKAAKPAKTGAGKGKGKGKASEAGDVKAAPKKRKRVSAVSAPVLDDEDMFDQRGDEEEGEEVWETSQAARPRPHQQNGFEEDDEVDESISLQRGGGGTGTGGPAAAAKRKRKRSSKVVALSPQSSYHPPSSSSTGSRGKRRQEGFQEDEEEGDPPLTQSTAAASKKKTAVSARAKGSGRSTSGATRSGNRSHYDEEDSHQDVPLPEEYESLGGEAGGSDEEYPAATGQRGRGAARSSLGRAPPQPTNASKPAKKEKEVLSAKEFAQKHRVELLKRKILLAKRDHEQELYDDDEEGEEEDGGHYTYHDTSLAHSNNQGFRPISVAPSTSKPLSINMGSNGGSHSRFMPVPLPASSYARTTTSSTDQPVGEMDGDGDEDEEGEEDVEDEDSDMD